MGFFFAMRVSVTNAILIVEDEDALSDALARRLVRRGFKVFVTADPEEAIDFLRTKQARLVISDINLNRPLTGLDIFYTMKNEQLSVPFVFFTGHGEGTSELDKALKGGADAVFSKPIDFQILYQKICALLGLEADNLSVVQPK